MWASLASTALSSASAYLGASAQAGMVEAENILARGMARAENTARRGQNVLSAAATAAARYRASLKDAASLEQIGRQVEQVMVNARRQDDALLAQSLEASVAAAEQQGAAAAMAAFSGAAGSVADEVNATTALRAARSAQEAEEFRGTAMYDTARMASSLFGQASGMGTNLFLDSLNYGTSIPKIKQDGSPLTAAVLAGAGTFLSTGGLEGLLPKPDSTGATFADPYKTTLDYSLQGLKL